MSRKRIGVLLAGCGYLDGAEIHESVLTLLFLDRAGAEAVCMAPDIAQAHVVDHRTGGETEETRNVLTEAARIARGRISAVTDVDPGSLDGLILPGGFGVAKNSCSFAFDGAGMKVQPDVRAMVEAVHAAGRPVGAWCIAPALIAAVIPGVRLTIGNDAGTARAVEALGAVHVECAVDDIVVDEERRVVTTPAYMYDAWTGDVAAGIEKGVARLLSMC